MKILVTGLNVFDSGKTWASIALYKAVEELGLKASIFKPIAAFDIWYGYRAYVQSLNRKVLLNNDVLMYEAYLNVTNLHLINPISIALAPLSPEYYRARNDLDGYYRDSQNLQSLAIISRVTDCDNNVTTHSYFEENTRGLAQTIRELAESLFKGLDAAPLSLNEFLGFISSHICEKMLSVCMDIISKPSDILIIESFNDSIAPFGRALTDSDYIFIIVPTMLYVYKNGEELIDFIEREYNKIGMEALRTNIVVRNLRPYMSLELKPNESPTEAIPIYKGLLTALMKVNEGSRPM